MSEVTLTRDELLVLLIEECAEIIQAVTKCQRFGFDHIEPGYGRNSLALAEEIGDVLGVIDALRADPGGIDRFEQVMALARDTKLARALDAKAARA